MKLPRPHSQAFAAAVKEHLRELGVDADHAWLLVHDTARARDAIVAFQSERPDLWERGTQLMRWLAAAVADDAFTERAPVLLRRQTRRDACEVATDAEAQHRDGAELLLLFDSAAVLSRRW